MIDTIIMAGTGAGAMSAKAPTSATVRTGYGKPRLVGVSVLGVTITSAQVQNTSKGWDSAGIVFPNTGNGAVTSGQQVWAGEHPLLPDAVDLDEQSVFSVTQVGAGASVVLLHIDYGGDYKPGHLPKGPLGTTRRFTAPAALTAVTVGGDVTVDTFEPEKTYIPSAAMVQGAFTGPQVLLGIDYPQTKGLTQFVPLTITNVIQGADQIASLKMMPAFKGRTQVRARFYSTTTDTPVADVYFVSSK